ncbi:unnamed protein product [Gongylonema pulchrum]|uniref:DUF4242 domain-containing protein n=1 Tax=Gongylonema pulchrum TaxID=637853 RepID=A0A183CU61_9BILA|nr:unnamed protein product [Gongylonema pulchrum]
MISISDDRRDLCVVRIAHPDLKASFSNESTLQAISDCGCAQHVSSSPAFTDAVAYLIKHRLHNKDVIILEKNFTKFA